MESIGVKVQNLLNRIKDKQEKEPAVVFKIPCNSNYLGESLKNATTTYDAIH